MHVQSQQKVSDEHLPIPATVKPLGPIEMNLNKLAISFPASETHHSQHQVVAYPGVVSESYDMSAQHFTVINPKGKSWD